MRRIIQMKTLKTVLLSTAVVAGFGILLGGKEALADEVYTVQPGDTLSAISYNFFGTVDAIDQIVKVNDITDKNLIFVGEELILPTDGTTPVAAAPAQTYNEPAPVVEQAPAPVVNNYSSNVSGSEAEAKEWIAFKESSGSYTATNGQYYGRYQLTNTYLNGDYSPENQERVADQYVAQRYGSWVAAQQFWLANGWY